MAVKRIVSTAFWTDSKVDMFSPEDKYFMLYLLTNPHTTQLGIYELSPKHAAFELGYSQESVMVLLDRFESRYKIIARSKSTREIAIRNYLKHSIVKGGKPVLDCLNRELRDVKDLSLVELVCQINKDSDNATVKQFVEETTEKLFPNGISLSPCTPSSSNASENENENDDSYHESYHESSDSDESPDSTSRKKEKTKTKPVKHKYGEFRHVMLSDEDFSKLTIEFPNDWNDRIRRLDEYIENTGKSYKNHLLTIKNWAKRDAEKRRNASAKPQNSFAGRFDEEDENYTTNPFLRMLDEERAKKENGGF